MGRKIEHIGTVVALSERCLTVRMTQQPACAGCRAQGICTPAKGEVRDVVIRYIADRFALGEEVKVVMQQRQGFRALAIGYMLPFVVLILALAIAHSLTHNDLMSGLIALATLIPYYTMIWIFFKNTSFGFTVSKLDNF